MASIKELHYQFTLNMDRVASLTNPDLNPLEIDILLNEAQLIFIKQRMGINNSKKAGFETSQKRIDDLANLVVKYPLQPAIVPEEVSPGLYEVDLTKTTFPYFFLVNAYALVQVNDNCERKVPLKFTQHDDFNDTLRDPFNRGSRISIPYNYGRNTTNTGSSLFLYTTQVINSVAIEYIKYPSRVSLGSYTYLDGTIYPARTFETAEHTHLEILDIACQLAARNIENPEYINVRDQKTLINE